MPRIQSLMKPFALVLLLATSPLSWAQAPAVPAAGAPVVQAPAPAPAAAATPTRAKPSAEAGTATPERQLRLDSRFPTPSSDSRVVTDLEMPPPPPKGKGKGAVAVTPTPALGPSPVVPPAPSSLPPIPAAAATQPASASTPGAPVVPALGGVEPAGAAQSAPTGPVVAPVRVYATMGEAAKAGVDPFKDQVAAAPEPVVAEPAADPWSPEAIIKWLRENIELVTKFGLGTVAAVVLASVFGRLLRRKS